MQAVKCPVCEGKGVVYGIAETGAMPTTTCHGCDGRGWVEVGDSDAVYPATTTFFPGSGITFTATIPNGNFNKPE